MLDLKVTLVKTFGWSVKEIDETNVESLLRFLRHFNATQTTGTGVPKKRRIYCDQVSWL